MDDFYPNTITTVDAQEVEIEDESIGHYVIEDDQTAEWAMQQIAAAEAERKKWKDFYDERMRIVDEKCDQTIANMQSLLQTYFEKVPHKVTATQENYTLPSGKLVFKKQAPEYQKDDEEVIEWLHMNSDEQDKFIKVKETLNWSELKKVINVMGDTVADENGQIMPIKVVERPDIFKVEIKKEK